MPVSIARLRELLDLAGSEGVESIDVVEDGTRIRITRSGDGPVRKTAAKAATTIVANAAANADPDVFTSPMFGVLHLTPAPDAKPYVQAGDTVAKGQQLGLIEAMKMFNPILSDRHGQVAAILADPGGEVAQGQPLFRIVRI